jgi:hypothetical protein
MTRRIVGQVIYDDDTGKTTLEYAKMYQPISPLDIAMYILLRDALEDLAIDVELKRLNLDTTMKISGNEALN